MAKSESITLLFKILKQSRYPVSLKQLEEKLECSTASVERYILYKGVARYAYAQNQL